MKKFTLATRLSIAFSLICCSVFLGVGIFSYHNMQHLLMQQRDQNLIARIERIELFLQDHAAFGILVQHPSLYENMLGQEDNLLILRNNDHTLIHINPLKINIPPLTYSNQILFLDHAKTRLAYKMVKFNQQNYQLVAGIQLTQTEKILNQYLRHLILYSLIGLLIASLLGRWIGLYFLRSLNRLIEQTERIQANQLDQRFEIDTETIEVEKLRCAMNKMLEKIQANYNQLARFSEDIAHELRTPLNNLIGQTQITLMQSRSQQDLEQLLQSHLEEYEHLSKMVDNMLFIARSEHHDFKIEKEWINLSDVILNLVQYFEFLAEDQKMSFSLNLQENIQIYANADLLKRALSNLIINAIDYGLPNHVIGITAQNIENRVEIQILSQNIFIDQQHLAHLFERFYQIESSRQAKAKTGGLGLAIVQSIMQLHQGEAQVKNTNDGVVFSLIFYKI